jgi:hypothetical protein
MSHQLHTGKKQDWQHIPRQLYCVKATPVVCWIVVCTIGAVEGIYGRTQYVGDWISYLNVSRAVSALDWKGIFDPMWSPGYPILVAFVRGVFPHTAEGEWNAITLLNWTICVLAFGSWRYLVHQAIECYDPALKSVRTHPVVVCTTSCAFLSCAACLDRVSSVCPDLLVTTLFILASAHTLSLMSQPSIYCGARLGGTLGMGCWVKGILLSLSGMFLFVVGIEAWSKKRSARPIIVCALIFFVFFGPLVTALSLSYGELTVGVSGFLNYAYHVNHVPHWTNWEGPSQSGTLLHPIRRLIHDLPAFDFGSPFRTTYSSYNNLAYWYQGLNLAFSPRLQAIAIARNFLALGGIIKRNPFLLGLTAMLCALMVRRDWRTSVRTGARRLWPLLCPSLAGIAAYLLVHVEERYISPFFLVLSFLPLLPLLDEKLKSKHILSMMVLTTYFVGTLAELAVADGAALKAAFHRADFHHDEQWQLAAALSRYGLRNGDSIALIDNNSPAYRCHWAYTSNLRIVAEFGSLPWTLAPWDRNRFDHVVNDPADEDYGVLFWKKLTPARRAQVIDAFHRVGARAVVALSGPDIALEPGWQKIPATNAFIYCYSDDKTNLRTAVKKPQAKD